MMRFADKTSTGIDIGALEKLARETERTMNLILGPLFGLFLSGAIIYSLWLLFKAGFATDPARKKREILAFAILWLLVAVIAMVWAFSPLIKQALLPAVT